MVRREVLTVDNLRIVYRILSIIEKKMEYTQFDLSQLSPSSLGVSLELRNNLLCSIISAGYVEGATIKRNVLGEISIDLENARLSIAGMEYLSENSVMQKIARAAKGIAEVVL